MDIGKFTDEDEVKRLIEEMDKTVQTIDFDEFAAFLKSKVKGQDAVIDGVCRGLRQRMNQLGESDRKTPIGVFCFAGPPGVGKTYLAGFIAERVFGESNRLYEFPMESFAEEHKESTLFGVPIGFHGHGQPGKLAEALIKTPECVIVLDEFEKAHPKIRQKFLNAFNSGYFLDVGVEKKVSTKSAIFILTTNAAYEKIGELTDRFPNPTRREEDEMVRGVNQLLTGAGWSPELVDRIEGTYAFSKLSGVNMASLIGLEILKIAARFGVRVAEKGIDPLVLAAAVKRGKDLGGIRPLVRAIEREISDGLIDARNAGHEEVRLKAGQDGAIDVVPAKKGGK